MIILLYIVIAILAFVFGITISNTIHKESTVIGTLRASGYTRRELILHYMTAPMLVTFAGAVIGNILGYTVLKNVCAGMYYGSYSLPTYVTLWNGEAFVMTTIVPVFLMAVINFFLLKRTLSLSPLKFLRRDLKKRKQKYTLPLSARSPFFSASCDFPECQQLCCAYSRNSICKPAFDVWVDASADLKSLSNGNRKESVVQLSVYFKYTVKCDE